MTRAPTARARLVAGFLLLTTIGAACRKRAETAAPEIRASVLPFLSYAPIYLADEEGDFRAEGLAVHLVPSDSDASAIVSFLAGQTDVYSGMISIGALNAIAEGAKLTIVADKGRETAAGCAYSGYVVRSSFGRPAKEPSAGDLRTASARIPRLSTLEWIFERLLRDRGVEPSAVREVEIPFPAIAGALASGQVDIVGTSEPELTRLVQGGGARLWMRATDVIPSIELAYVVFGRRLHERERPLGVRFLKGYLRGVRRYREGKTERNLDILSRRTGFSREQLRQACWAEVDPRGEIDPTTLPQFEEWARQSGHLSRVVPMSEICDPSLAREASASLDRESPR